MARRSLIRSFFYLLATRPYRIPATVRSVALFHGTRFFQKTFFPPGPNIHLGSNVRIQRLRCLLAERPSAGIFIGAHSIVYENARIEAYGKGQISMGESSIIGDARIYSRHEIRIGRRFMTSWNVFIQDYDPHPTDPTERGRQIEAMAYGFYPRHAPVPSVSFNWDFPGEAIHIGDDVWLGANVTILKGARIGDGCIVASGAMVLGGDYPARSIIAGNPARVVKTL